MFRAVIIDDIEAARRTLADDIYEHCPDVAIVGEAGGVRSGIQLIERIKPDVVFLDIELEDGSGFDLLEVIGAPDFKVIFTTASDAFGIKAIKFSAIDYLLKPIDTDELSAAVEKVRRQQQGSSTRENVEILLESLKDLRNRSRRIALNTADKIHIVDLDEIIQCESQRNYTLFHLTRRRQILVTRTLKEFSEMLEEHGFFRIHHSHLINTRFIKEYVKGDGGYIVMTDNSEIPVATRKKEALMKALALNAKL
jgi:two-component system LytT family response regulator